MAKIFIMPLCYLLLLYKGLDASTCQDKVRDCSNNREKCTWTGSWGDYMGKYCQSTCGKCGSGGTGSCGVSSIPQSRVIAGVTARPGSWPWMASLNYRTHASHFCGGTLITPQWVVTASHCTQGKSGSQLKVILGEHDRNRDEGHEQHINVRRLIQHPNYNPNTLINDIALLELERPAQLNTRVQVACLPRAGEIVPINTQCYLSGWGSVVHPGRSYHLLQQAMLPVVDKKNCFNKDGFVCTGFGFSKKTNACRGDSGGPLVCQANGKWVHQGVASFVTEYCKYYTAFTRVSDHINWIKRYVPV